LPDLNGSLGQHAVHCQSFLSRLAFCSSSRRAGNLLGKKIGLKTKTEQNKRNYARVEDATSLAVHHFFFQKKEHNKEPAAGATYIP
jgi:hypothetical protein